MMPQDCPINKPKKKRSRKNLEAGVLKEGIQWLRQHGLFIWRSNTGAVRFDSGGFLKFGFVGSADITGILPDGRRLECEAKRRVGGKQSDKQKIFQNLIEANDGIYVLFHSVEELAEKLTPILQHTGVLIPLTRGYSTRIDLKDWDQISSYKWHVGESTSNLRYAERSADRVTVRMHRQILMPPLEFIVDHINGDGLDNRRCNLRVGVQKENTYNSRPSFTGTSRFKGVYFDTRTSRQQKPWIASIQPGGKKIHLGSFAMEDDAARAYDKKARELYGEFAYLNFPR